MQLVPRHSVLVTGFSSPPTGFCDDELRATSNEQPQFTARDHNADLKEFG